MKTNNLPVFPLGLFIIGFAIFLNRIDFFPESWEVLFTWQILFILLGGFLLWKKHTVGLAFLLIGILFIIARGYLPEQSPFRFVFPILLMLAGIFFYFAKKRHQAKSDQSFEEDLSKKIKGQKVKKISIQDGILTALVKFDTFKETFFAEKVKQARLTSFFSELELDLSEMTAAAKELDFFVTVGFSQMTIIVKEGWVVENHLNTTLGNVKLKGIKTTVHQSSKSIASSKVKTDEKMKKKGSKKTTTEKKIILQGNVLLGAFHLKTIS